MSRRKSPVAREGLADLLGASSALAQAPDVHTLPVGALKPGLGQPREAERRRECSGGQQGARAGDPGKNQRLHMGSIAGKNAERHAQERAVRALCQSAPYTARRHD